MTTELPPDLPHRRTPVADARALIVAASTPLPTESVALADLAGRVVGAPVIAPHDLPRHANSAMDGYAVAADTPSPWPLSAHILAGDDPAPPVPGTAAAIATGGVVLDGTTLVGVTDFDPISGRVTAAAGTSEARASNRALAIAGPCTGQTRRKGAKKIG